MKGFFSVAAFLLVCLTGCVNPLTRGQAPEDKEREKDLSLPTVGDVTEVANVQPTQVSGVSFVTQLKGTGHSGPGQYRTMLEKHLRQHKIENVKELLDSPDCALVLVSAFIPPGARKGDPIDLEVTLPPGSKATSLHGGVLQPCDLRDYSNTRNLSSDNNSPERWLQGHIRAKVKQCPLLVGLGNPGEPAEMRRGRVWQGGVCLEGRPFYLIMKKDEQSSRVANFVAERINAMFQDDISKQQAINRYKDLYVLSEITDQLNQTSEPMVRGAVAKAVNKEIINVRVPYGYRFNSERYLRVARLMPLREAAEHKDRYRRRLEKMLLDPAETIRAALRLEALGRESIPALKAGLASEHALVRFAAAESLAYLGSTAGIEELARLAEAHGELKSFCLLAIAGLDESVCRTRLNEMLSRDDVELRCGAFVALRQLHEGFVSEPHIRLCVKNKETPPLGVECLGRSIFLHQLAPASSRLVYLSIEKRAEVVLFGEDIHLQTPVKILVRPEFTVVADANDDRCTISRITAEGMQTRQCSLALADVLRTLTGMGGQYPEVVDLLRRLNDQQGLNCPVAINRLPVAVSAETLAEEGRAGNLLRNPAR